MRSFCLSLLLLLTLSVHAQMGVIYDADHFLPSSCVSSIYQDRDGYIWIATRDGVCRFDGYQFQTFNSQTTPDLHLDNNYVNHIMQTRSGRIYLSENNGLQYYDGGTFHTVTLQDRHGRTFGTYVTQVLERRNGDILASTSGYGLLRVQGDGRAVRLEEGIYRNINFITRIAEDAQQRLWILTEDQGLLCVSGGHVQRFFKDQGRSASVRSIVFDREGNAYVTVRQQGLFVLRRGSRQFEHVDAVTIPNMEILSLGRNGQLYIGTDGHGACVYNPRTTEVHYNPFICMGMDLTKSKVNEILEDRNGNLWMAIFQKGVFMQRAHQLPFGYLGYRMGGANVIGSNSVSAVRYDRQGRLWVGTDKDGVYLLDAHHQLIRHFYDGVPTTVLQLHEDQQGRMWVGSYAEGVGYFDAALTWHRVTTGVSPNCNVFAMTADRQGNMWIGTMGEGLVSIHPDGSFTRYRMCQGAENDRKKDCLVNDYISALCLSPDGRRLYISTTVGQACLNLRTGSFTDVFHTNCVNHGFMAHCAIEDARGTVWIGTDHGLLGYNPTTRQQRRFTMKDGLSNNNVSALVFDRHGTLWATTVHGLNQVNTQTGHINCYFANNGLQSNEFSVNAITANQQGQIAMGGTGGVSFFQPDRFQATHPWKARVRISSIVLNNRELQDSLIADKRKLSIAYNDNAIIRLSTLTYEDSWNITFLYSINGDEWLRLQPGHNEISFAHLAPGTYHLRVKAAHDRQETPVEEFTIHVAAPWYASPLAYAIYILLLIAAAWTYLRHRKAKERERLELQEHIHAEEMGEAKVKFFMNMSHEIRTPMTLIVAPLLQLLREDGDVHRQGIYRTMRRNAERILNLINQMMDLRKIEKGQMPIRMRETNLTAFTRDVYTLFEQQAQHRHIDLTLQSDADPLMVWIDRTLFDKVLVNLLSNAFKYTPSGGHIAVAITHDDKEVHITVSDDGEQIPTDKLETIFDRFYEGTTKTANGSLGTGIGLDLTRSIVELHYGVIRARNLDEGCAFIVTLPLGNAHLKPSEMIIGEENDDNANEAQSLLDDLAGGANGSLAGDANATLKDSSAAVTDGQGSSADAIAITVPPVAADSIPLDNRRIVVAEDDDEIAQYLKQQLSPEFDVDVYPNGKEALQAILQRVPALVISDVMMPVMDGNQLCSRMKANVLTNHVPVILLTAKNSDDAELEGLESGADRYIVKPFNMDILHRTIVNLLRERAVLRNKYTGAESQDDKVTQIELDSPDKKLMDRIMRAINDNLTNSDLSVDQIAQLAGISRVHLYRKMKELTNQTPHGFIRNLRVKQAARLLEDSHQSITEVMYACGFSNPASFSTTFKSVYGLSPRDYQKQHRA